MIDSTNQAAIVVSTEGTAGPYIMVPLDQLEAVTSVLRDNQISFWVDAYAISLHGRPEIAVVNLDRRVNAAQVQRLLDAVQ
jgi:hypothetical protein